MIQTPAKTNSILNTFIAELRDENIQKDNMRFRKNLERIGEIFAYEISKTFSYKEKSIITPLGESKMLIPENEVVIASIMRAGLPMHQGFLNFFDRAENAFISAFRKYHKDGTFDIQFGYMSSPDINKKTLILSDPMLASGSSMVLAYKSMLEKGKPEHTHIVSIIASKEGIDFFKKKIASKNVTLWVGAIDDELTAKAYIVPGLGDAGDLAYGAKE
ncbi:MAG: uracil phosphoribosyltransferase [Bacteroidales bacterium]|nr:uracil phosphoribosyltransferase [Bacteroidales bacterium]MBN2755942.1 uracil phosphoribosyltransferase [Bacteroidales bacterium]